MEDLVGIFFMRKRRTIFMSTFLRLLVVCTNERFPGDFTLIAYALLHDSHLSIIRMTLISTDDWKNTIRTDGHIEISSPGPRATLLRHRTHFSIPLLYRDQSWLESLASPKKAKVNYLEL